MNTNVIEVNDTTFTEQVEQAEGLTFVDFWAPWCAPCRIVGPTVERLAERYAGRVRFAKVNVDDSPHIATSYQIGSIPTLAIFKDGVPVTGVAGAVPEQYLVKMIDEQLGA